MSFRLRLRQAREYAGMTQQQVADALEIDKTTYSGYETGKRSPDVERIKNIARVLNTTGDWLLETGLESQERQTLAPEFVAKKSPAPAEASTEEISLEESNNLLVALGYIKPGEQISDEDLAFLGHVIGLLDTWFDKGH